MEFAVSRQVLAEELNKLQSVIPKKAVIQSLTLIRVESDSDGGIRMVASNLETTIYSHVTSKLLAVSVPGVMCLPAKRLIDIIRLMKDGPVKISTDANDWLHIIAQGSRLKLPGISASQYPDLPSFDSLSALDWIEVPMSHLKNMLPAVKYAITGDEARIALRGAKLEVDSENAEVRLITTDGHRISLASGKLEGLLPGDFDVLIPIESIDELSKLLSDKAEGTVGLARDDNSLYFRIGSRILATRQVAGKFPSYQMPFSMLGTYEHFANFKAEELARSIRMVLLCAEESADKEKKKHQCVTLEFGPQTLQIKSQSPELGEATEVIDSDYNGPPMAIGFNGRYLLDFLDPVGSGTFRFEVKSPNQQTYLIGERDGVTYYYCCMPMRIT